MTQEKPGREVTADPQGAPIEIILDGEGQVVFTDLPPELLEVVGALDPDAPRGPTFCPIEPESAVSEE